MELDCLVTERSAGRGKSRGMEEQEQSPAKQVKGRVVKAKVRASKNNLREQS